MNKSRKSRDVYAFVADGETEKWYLQKLKEHETKLTMTLKPELPSNKTIKQQYELVCDLAQEYTKVFWIIDLDVVIKESREAKKTAVKPINVLKECLSKLENRKRKNNNVFVLMNTPCLEYWILLHLERTSKYYDNCDRVISAIKSHHDFANYAKTEKYYKQKDNDIYFKLKNYLQDALTNANSLENFNFENIEKGISEMHLLFKELGLCEENFILK